MCIRDRDNVVPVLDYPYENEWNLGVDAAVGRRFGRHTLVFRAGFEGRWGGDRKGESVWAAPSDYYNRTYSGAFRYAYRARSVDMEFGLDYYRDDVAGRDAANYFIPYAHLRFDLGGGGFVPYVELDGTLKHNDMRELMETNLYYVPRYTDLMPRNTVDYSVRVGVSGRLVEDKLIYRLFVGYSFIENHNFWYCYTPTTRYEGFSLVQGRLNVMSLNGELEFRPVSNFTFSIGGRGLTYTEHQTLSIGLPEFEGTVRARYHHRKFSVGLVFDLQSNRYISRVIPWFPNDGIVGNMRIPYTVDLGLNVDWYASKRVTVFAEGHNLCNRRIYDWSTFPQYSAGFTAGVKLSF